MTKECNQGQFVDGEDARHDSGPSDKHSLRVTRLQMSTAWP
jgi:hypothetical protein